MQHETLTGTVIGCAMRVHGTLGAGFLESVYQKALAVELGLRALAVERERRVRVQYRDQDIGDFVVDLLVDGRLLVETKAARSLAPRDVAQVVNYLAATGIEVGLLLNFGSERLQFRRVTRRSGPGAGR
jgi:GxxExxY protein